MTEPRNTAVPPDDGADWERMAVQIERGHPDGAGYVDGLSDEDLAVFAEATAVTRELEAEDDAAAAPGVLPFRRPARQSPWLDRRWWAAAAAVIAAVTLIPLATRGGGAVREPSQAVAMLENPAAGLPAGWLDDPVWGGTRSGEGDPLMDETLSVRVGASMVALELAVRARDAEQTRLLVDRITRMLTNASTSGTVAAISFTPLHERAGALPAELLPVLEDASDAVSGAVDPDRFALGAWAEGARLAAARWDAAYFRGARTRRTLAKADDLLAADEEARTALTAIRASLDADTPDWARLGAAAKQLLFEIAS